jgi:hypothetical protein
LSWTSLPRSAHELRVVVAGHAQGRAGGDHAHDQAQHLGRFRAAVDEVTEEDRAPALRRTDLEPSVRSPDPVPELLQQLDQLVGAAVHVADDVERARLVPAVGPQRPAPDGRGVDLLRRGEDRDVPEALPLQTFEGPVKLAGLVPDHVRAEVSVGAGTVPLAAHGFWQI